MPVVSPVPGRREWPVRRARFFHREERAGREVSGRRIGRRRGVLLVALGILAALWWAAPAGAHAELISTTPSQGATVAKAPPVVVMTYSEGVSVSNDGIRLLDPAGAVVPRTKATADGSEVRIDVPDLSDEGTYTVDWKAVSAEGHPIRGAWTFNLGAEGGGADVALGSTGQSPAITALRAVGRSVSFLALFVLAGQLLWAGITRWRPLVAAAWAGVILVVAAELWAALAGGASNPAAAAQIVLGTPSGRFLVATVLLVAYGHLMCRAGRLGSRSLGVVWTSVVVAAALVGHATVLSPVALSAFGTVAHVLAAGLWVSALVWMAGVLPGCVRRVGLESRASDALASGVPPSADSAAALAAHRELLRRAVRFSPWGMGAVAVLLATGGALLWVRIGGPMGLLTSGYGLLGLGKLLVLAGAVVLAARNRWVLIPALASALPELSTDEADATAARRSASALQRAIHAEMVLVACAVALGGVLGATALPRDTAANPVGQAATAVGAEVFSEVADFGPYQAQVEISPRRVGPNVAHVTVVNPAGPPPDDLSGLTVSFTLPAADLGPIEPKLIKLNDSHITANDVVLTAPGLWTVTVDARRGSAEFLRATFQVNIDG